MQYLGSIGTVSVISESLYKGLILQRYMKMTYNSFIKFHALYGSIGTVSVISESRYKGTILQRTNRKMTTIPL